MKRRILRLAAGVLAGGLIITSLYPGAVSAQEYSEDTVTRNIEMSEQDTLENISEVEDNQKTETGALSYLYVESPYLEAPEVQNLVISWGDGTEQIEKMELLYQYNNQEISSFELENKGEGLYLYQKEFTDSESGVYALTDIRITQEAQEYTYNLSEMGISACFGINEKYPGYELEKTEESEYVDKGTAVITEDDVENSKAEEIVLETLEAVDAQMGVSAYSLDSDDTRSSDGQVVVALDAGHDALHAGGFENGIHEEEATLKIAQYCKEELEKYVGVKVYMCRDSAECPYPGTTATGDIRERVKASVEQEADVYVSIHLNSSVSSAASGAEVWYPDSSQTPDTTEPGKNLAQKVQDELIKLGLKDRGAKETDDNFACMDEGGKYGLPAIIIEHAFISNLNDVNNYLNSDAKLQKIGIADATGIVKYFGLSNTEWVFVNGHWMWKEDGQYAKSKWIYYNKTWYWVDANGYRVTGWQEIYGKTYYFEETGQMVTGTVKIGDKTYQFGSDGAYQGEVRSYGWSQESGNWYWIKNDGSKAVGWEKIEGYWYYFDKSGKMQTGWKQIGGYWYYLNQSGKMETGLQEIGGCWYYLDNSGKMQTGWKMISSYWYYFEQSGKMQTGWKQIGGYWYYFNQSGKMQTGWQKINGKTYYFVEAGQMVTGTVTIENKKYLFGSDGAYQREEITPGWHLESGIWYWIKNDGSKAVGWEKIGGYWYYFDQSGKMQTGWKLVGGCWYYLENSGKMQTGWKMINSCWYYFEQSGKMQTGWKQIGGYWYYLNQSGKMETGWQEINGKTYYFVESGQMVTGTVTIENKKYQFGSDGAYQREEITPGWHLESGIWYWIKNDGSKAVGWEKIGGYWYYFDQSGKMQTGWQEIGEKTYYFVKAGQMVTGWQQIDNKTYYFQESGSMCVGWIQIDGVWNYFNANGEFIQSGVNEIEGSSQKSKEQMVNFFKNSGYTYPAEELGKGGADTIERFVDIYFEEAEIEGIRAEVAFAQAMLETGYLQFNGDVKIEQFNFAGLGVTGNGVSGEQFADVRTGARAHIQHLKAYATSNPLVQECVDGRYVYVTKGCAPYVEWLGIQENPDKKGWAVSQNYGFKIVKMLKLM